MNSFPQSIRFAYPWRAYQAKALEEMDAHLQDERLHLVAPPGSGKTVLGLEIMRRLGRPTLIVAPTKTIQGQWAHRFREDFGANDASWISMDLRDPQLMTVTTYQMIFKVFDSGDGATILEKLRARGVNTLILDEAHHLKRAWWEAVLRLRAQLAECRTIALTATPPYDSQDFEWDRYIELCGQIDTEIPVPELVLNGDLCPHLDLLYFDYPDAERLSERRAFHQQISRLVDFLPRWTILADHLRQHPWIKDPISYESEIYSDVAWFSSALIYLKEISDELEADLLELLDADAEDLPAYNIKWAQVLLRGILSTKQKPQFESEFLDELVSLLKNYGAIERKVVQLLPSNSLDRRILRSASKLNSIEAITKIEALNHGEQLRLLVLSDYIYPEFLGSDCEVIGKTKTWKLGAVPVFERLRFNGIEKVALLTGALVVIPVSAIPVFQNVCDETGLAHDAIKYHDIEHLPNFRQLRFSDSLSSAVVRAITKTFDRGVIQVLSGTQALLGEGWDAPCLNSLIIASNVGSFVSSNQIRGRAIRTDPKHPNKVSKVWHLVTLTGIVDDEPDFSRIRRRLKTFVGPASEGHGSIRSGFERLGIPAEISSHSVCEEVNNRAEKMSGSFEWIRNSWLKGAENQDWKGKFFQSIQLSGKKVVQRAFLSKTVEAAFYTALITLVYTVMNHLDGSIVGRRDNTLWIMLMVAFGIGLIRTAPDLWKAIRLYRKYGFTGVTADAVARSLLRSMKQLEAFDEDIREKDLQIDKELGVLSVSLKGGSRMDRHHFSSAFLEMMGPIHSPKHLAVHANSKRTTYFAIPNIQFPSSLARAELGRQMKRALGKVSIINCRTREGRKVLLKARANSILNDWDDTDESITRWE